MFRWSYVLHELLYCYLSLRRRHRCSNLAGSHSTYHKLRSYFGVRSSKNSSIKKMILYSPRCKKLQFFATILKSDFVVFMMILK